jgi:hypothetical protein
MPILFSSLQFFFRVSTSEQQMDADQNAVLPPASTKVGLKIKKHFKLLSWNIDGLDSLQDTLAMQTGGVIDVIIR